MVNNKKHKKMISAVAEDMIRNLAKEAQSDNNFF
jgi:hypothetical protein